MALRKVTIDISVRDVSKDGHPQSEQAPHVSKQKNSTTNTRKKSFSRNKRSQKQKKFIKKRTAGAIRILK